MTGQLNSVDINSKERKSFAVYAGTEEAAFFDAQKNKKVKNITSSKCAVTAIKISPDSEYLVYATGSDWSKGVDEL